METDSNNKRHKSENERRKFMRGKAESGKLNQES
jgi:hypothetical protein